MNDMKQITELMLHMLEPKIACVEARISKRGKWLGLCTEYLVVTVAITTDGEEYELSRTATGWNPDMGDLTIHHDLPYKIDLKN